MRLKSLTLSGFKSFPKRTTIHFPKGISAIVGPNGCGKSNIIDAIRWVLGEQSPRILRAKQMSDLIFRGANGSKAPASAYVKLVLENLGRLMPPELEDLPEIEIERILFANGDAKYRLNRKNCRLKEIRYLFMDTGAGTRAYSIIDQGQVNEFVEMSPEERRFMVEEVAGISRYKARRSEAKRQMDETRLNLERLEDIIHEVERQMRSLKRQAGKARRYMELSSKVKALEMGILAGDWQEKGRQAGQISQALGKIQEELELLEAKRADLGLKEKGLSLELEALNSRLGRKRAGLRKLREEAEACQDAINGLERRKVDLLSRKEGTERRLQEAQERKEAIEERLSETIGEIEGLSGELSRISRLEEEKERYLEQIESETASLRQAGEELKGRLMDLLSRRARAESEISRLEERLEHLEQKSERGMGQQRLLEEESAQLLERQRQADESLKGLEEQARELTKATEALRARRKETEDEMARLDQEISRLEAVLSDLNIRLSTLEALERAGAGLSEGEKVVLSSKEGRDLQPLAASLKVAPGWEAVVEAALGAMARSLVVDGLQEVKELSRVVKEAGRGSAGLMVTGLYKRGDRGGDRGKGPGDRGQGPGPSPLSQRARALDRAGQAALAHLERCFFSEDLDGAVRLAGHIVDELGMEGPFWIVTRDLCVLSHLGQVHLSSKVRAEDGIIYRRAKIDELSRKKGELASGLEELKRKRGQLQDRLDQIRKDMASKRGVLEELDRKMDGVRRERERLGLLRDKALSRLELIEFDLHEAGQEMEDAKQRLSRLEGELSEIVKEEGALKGQVQQHEERMKRGRQRLSSARAELERVRMELARTRATLEEKRRLHDSLKGDMEDLVSHGRNLTNELEKLHEEIAGCSAELREKAQQLDGMREREQDLFREIRKLEEEAGGLDDGLRQLRGSLQETRHQISLLLERKRSLEGELRQIEERRLSIEQELQVRFGASVDGLDPAELLSGLDAKEAMEALRDLKGRMEKMGSVNLAAIDDYGRLEERYGYLMEQKADLVGSLEDVEQAIDKIDRECTQKFKEALKDINDSLSKVFPLLFDGGSARLEMTGQTDIWDAGIDYRVELPGKRIGHLGLLSGGEKALSALALIFAIFFIKPSPFCLLDEVDAPLDEANTERFNRLVKKVAANSQVLLVTHNQRVMEIADTLYGVTMEEKGVSKLVSVNLVEQGGRTPLS